MSKKKKIGLNNFIESERILLEQFSSFWLRMRKKNPENYPEELEPWDWDEQYAIWCDSKNRDFP